MAVSTASFNAIDWIAHTFAPPRLTAWGMTQIATDLTASPKVNSTPRLTNAINYMAAREADVWAAYVPAWDQFWQQAGEAVFVDFLGAMPADTISTLMSDPDVTARRALKQFLRSLEMLYLQFLAGG